MEKKKPDRLFDLLSYVGFCVDFPQRLVSRTGGHPDWMRTVMHRALEGGYLTLWQNRTARRVVTSLRLTDKGMDYIACQDIRVFEMIAAQRDSMNRGTHNNTDKVLRRHSCAAALVMARNAGVRDLPQEKPPLTMRDQRWDRCTADPEVCYFYTIQEVRRALAEHAPNLQLKGSSLTGIIVRGEACYYLYDTRGRRMFWMRATEENFAGAVEALLNLRGFQVCTMKQVILGDRMMVAKKLYRRSSKYSRSYFALSLFYKNCYFLPNSRLGDWQLRAMLDRDRTAEIRRQALASYAPAREGGGFWDATDPEEGRPALLNWSFDLLALQKAGMAVEEQGKTGIVLCFDHQVSVMQSLVGPQVEVRGIGEVERYG